MDAGLPLGLILPEDFATVCPGLLERSPETCRGRAQRKPAVSRCAVSPAPFRAFAAPAGVPCWWLRFGVCGTLADHAWRRTECTGNDRSAQGEQTQSCRDHCLYTLYAD